VSAAIGRSASTGMGLVTHFANLKRGLVPKSAVSLCTIGDYLVMKLAGKSDPVMDATNAASLSGFDLANLCFDTAALRSLGCEPGFLPEVTQSYPALGEARFGVPVFPAVGDNQASFLGSVADRERMLLVNVGTGSQVSLFVPGYRPINGIDLRPLPFGGYIGVGAGLCGGRAYAAIREFFRETVRAVTGKDEEIPWDVMNAMKPSDPTEPLKVDTRFSGTRLSPSLRGSITNVGLFNLTPEHLVSGVREGIVAELLDFSRLFDQEALHRMEALVGSGNAIRLCEPLRQAFESGFNVPLRMPRHREEASFGAALVAGVASGTIPDVRAACSLVRYEDR